MSNDLTGGEIAAIVIIFAIALLLGLICEYTDICPTWCQSERKREKRRIQKEVDKRLRFWLSAVLIVRGALRGFWVVRPKNTKTISREIEEQNRINEMERRSSRLEACSASSSDSSISEPVVEESNQTPVQVDFDPPAYKDVSIPMAGSAFENEGFQSTDDL